MSREGLWRLKNDFFAHLAFFSRLPVPATGVPDFAQAWWALPAVGIFLGMLAGLIVSAATLLGMSPLLAASCGILALVALSGALHEDGLADCCDALGGGTIEKRLAILRDSRIGTFGTLALIFSVLLRSAALFELLRAGTWIALAALVGAVSLSRAAALAPLALLPPARSDGLGASAAASRPGFGKAFLVGSTVVLLTNGPLHPLGTIVALLCAFFATLGVVRVARRCFGGQTGDVAGAAVQAAEIVFLTGLATFVEL